MPHKMPSHRISYFENQKGGIVLSATGYIQARAYTSNAQIPLEDVAISVTATDGTAIAMRLTNRNGLITPISLPVPDLAASQSPNPEERPFAVVNLYARLQGYEQIEIENLQIFADTITDQNLEMIPLSELPSTWDQTEIFDTPAQNL
ncbi:MAG: spore cortex-lytic protein [Oscillospiraceae bacterium]|nr:spore cortex-lytic protein [Oscillospiraceae bacterium]